MVSRLSGPWPRRAAFIAALLCAGAAHAQTPEETRRRAVAQALFDEATALMEQNQYSAACIKLEEVVRLQPGKIGALLTLARCYEGEGKVASAWSRYKNTAEAAELAHDSRLAEAKKKVDELQKRLPHLVIQVPERVAALVGLSVQRDGIDVGAAQWGTAIPMDAGEHHIEVKAQGREPWSVEATLTEGRETSITVPELEVKPEPTAMPTFSSWPLATASAEPQAGAFLGLQRRTWGFIVGGVGLAGVAAGAITGGLAMGQHDALAKVCPGGRCGADRRGEVDAYEAMGLVSTVTFIAGGALAAAGVTLWITAPSPRSAGVRVTPAVGPAGLGVTGQF